MSNTLSYKSDYTGAEIDAAIGSAIRSFFTSLADAQAAAATADEYGSTSSFYYYGQKIFVTEDGVDTWYVISRNRTLVAEGTSNSGGTGGADGVSPTAEITEIDGGHRVTITDVNGTESFDVMDGVSPTISAASIDGGFRITITDAKGTKAFDVMHGQNGKDGNDGDDGVSPTVEVTEIEGGHRITITDANGTYTVDVMDGTDGQDGNDGVSPTISIAEIDDSTGHGYNVIVTDADGTKNFYVMDGKDGVSPTLSVSAIEGGHRITYTEGVVSRYFDVMDGTDGTDGNDGISPTVEITEIEGGHNVAITDANGTQSFYVMDGKEGDAATPDLAVNDEASKAYVAGRTHYVADDGTVKKLDNQFLNLDWLPTISEETHSFGSALLKISIPDSNGYMGKFDGFTYDIFSGLSELKVNLFVTPTEGTENLAIAGTYPVVQQSNGYTVGNASLCNSSAEDTGEDFCIFMSPFFGDNVMVRTTVYGEAIFVCSYTVPAYNTMPKEFMPKDYDKGELVTVTGAKDDYDATIAPIYEAFMAGKTVLWKDSDASLTYRVLYINSNSTLNNIYMLLAKADRFESGIYYYLYPASDTGYSLTLTPIVTSDGVDEAELTAAIEEVLAT